MGRVVHPHIITPDSALGGMDIRRSVRCGNGGAFTRTQTATGNQKVWTWSAWVKKWADGGTSHLFSSEGSNDGIAAIYFNGNKIHTYFDTSGANPYGAINDRYHRDPSSWMHIVWQVDALNTTQRIWINGQEESVASGNAPPNYAYSMNQSGKSLGLGISGFGGSHTNGTYLAEVHHSDGYKYDPSYYGYTEPQTGIWRPKKVTGILYGTNGFYLDFSDNSTAAALGKDRSGNGNDWSTNGSISVANDKTNDSLLDTPTNNFCTLNPIRRQANDCIFDQGNLQATGSSSSYPGAAANVALSSGKWYYEFQIDTKVSTPMCGVIKNDYSSGGAGRILYRSGGHYVMHDGAEPTTPDSYGVGDIIGVAIDLDDAAGKIRFYKNGTLQTVDSALSNVKSHLSISTLGGLLPYVQMYTNDVCTVNFGQRPFSYTPPSGHKKLIVNTNNSFLDNGTAPILDPKEHFNILLWTGNGSASRDITGLQYKPDLVWIKRRGGAQTHSWQDSLIGFGDDKTLRTDTTGALDTNGNLYGYINYTLKDGFNINGGTQASSNDSRTNAVSSNNTYVAWCWKAGGSSNTFNVDGKGYATDAAAGLDNGTISLTGASVNTEAGFSIVTYAGTDTGSSQTIPHGLNKPPQFWMWKRLTGTSNWTAYTTAIDGSSDYLLLNSTAAVASGVSPWSTLPTSSVVTVGTNNNDTCNAGDNYVMYSWHSVPGYSKFGSYTGNNDADGVYVHLGFRPAFLMIKNNTGDNWYISDVKRDPFNVHDHRLFADTNSAEGGVGQEHVDFLSSGFKFRRVKAPFNTNGTKFFYMAFAEQSGGVNAFRTSANAR